MTTNLTRPLKHSKRLSADVGHNCHRYRLDFQTKPKSTTNSQQTFFIYTVSTNSK